MTDELPDSITCVTCNHALRPSLPGGRYSHSGKAGETCACTICEGRFHNEFAYQRNLSAKERKALVRTAVEPPEELLNSSFVTSPGVPASPQESAAAVPPTTTYAGSPGDGTVVADAPGTKRVSNSEITVFKRCRRKWHIEFYRKLQLIQPEYAGPRAQGTKIHIALAQYYSPGPLSLNQTAAMLTLNALYKEDVERLAATVTDTNEMQVREITENLQKELDLSTIMLDGYWAWVEETGADADLEIISAEEAVEYPLSGFDVPVILMAKLDVRARRTRDGSVLFMDHKNVASISDTVKQLPMNEQFLTYMLLEKLLAPESQHVTGGLVGMLRKVKRTAAAKPPFYARTDVPHNTTELRHFWSRLHGEIREIVRLTQELDAGADHQMVAYPTPDRSCFWQCDHVDVCRMTDDGSRVEDYIAANYVVGDPYARYELANAED